MTKTRLVLAVAVILGLSGVACTLTWCSYHRYYCVSVGPRIYMVDRLAGKTWLLSGDKAWPVQSMRVSMDVFNERIATQH